MSRKIDRIFNILGIVSVLMIIATLCFYFYQENYIESRPFNIYAKSNDIKRLLNDREKELGKKETLIEEEEEIYFPKGEFLVFRTPQKVFALKTLVDIEFSLSPCDLIYESSSKEFFYYVETDSITFKVVRRQKYDGPMVISSEEIDSLISKGTWTESYSWLH